MAAGEADFLLDVRRPEHLRVDDGGVDVGAEAGERTQSEAAHLVAARIPRAVREGVRNVLREDAHGVLAGGDDGGVVDALEIELAPEIGGQFAAACRGKAGTPFGLGERDVDLAVVMRLVGAGARGEVGQLAEQDVELDGAALDGDAFDMRAPVGVGRGAEQAQRDARVGVGDDDGSGDALAAFEQDAFAGKNLRDGDAGSDDGAGFLRGVAEVEGDHAHAALHVAPHAGHAAEAAGGVMEADGGGAGIEGAGVGADDALAEVGDLQALVFEVVLDEFGHGPVVEQMAGFIVVAEAVVDFFGGGRVADPEIAVAGGTQSVAQAGEAVVHGAPALDIAGRKAADFRFAGGVIVPELNAGAVEHGDEEAVDGGGPVKSASGKVELFDNFGMQQSGEIGAGRHAHGGMRSGKGSSMVQAPPTRSRLSRTRTRWPLRAR